MGCYCGDYEAPDFYDRTEPKARKAHRCEECGGTIEPGTVHEKVSGKWGGELSTYRTCPACLEVRRHVKSFVPCFCWGHGNLIGDAIDTAREYAHEADGLLFGTLRRAMATSAHFRRKAKGAAR